MKDYALEVVESEDTREALKMVLSQELFLKKGVLKGLVETALKGRTVQLVHIVVAKRVKEVVGVIVAFTPLYYNRTQNLTEMYLFVKDAHRRKGVARGMLQEFEGTFGTYRTRASIGLADSEKFYKGVGLTYLDNKTKRLHVFEHYRKDLCFPEKKNAKDKPEDD